MNKLSIPVIQYLIVFLVLSSLSQTSAYAVTGSLNTITKERVETVKQIQSDARDSRQAAIGSLNGTREQLKEQRQALTANLWVERSKVHAANLKARFSRYYTIMNNLITRMQKRLDTMKADKKNVDAAQAKLSQAKEALAEAKTAGDQAVAMFNSFTSTDFSNRQAMTKQAADLANKARDQFKQVLRLLRDAVLALKEANGGDDTAPAVSASPAAATPTPAAN